MLTEIQSAVATLSPAERTVADWVLAHPRGVTEATIADVARETGVSEPTVVRFCRSIGARGFRDLKLRLAESVGRRQSLAHSDVATDDDVQTTVRKVMDRSIHALQDVRETCSSMPFEAAVEAMAAARQIVFVGLGASGDVARDACQKFFRLGLPCATATDAPAILQYGAIAGSSDLFVAISRSGRWRSLATAMQRAADTGAAVVALTSQGSTLARLATHTFRVDVEEDANLYTPMSSRLAQLTVLDALQVALALRLGDAADKRLRASKQAIVDNH